MCTFAADVEQGLLPALTNEHPLHYPLSAMVFYLCSVVAISLYKMAPKSSAEVLCSFPRCRDALSLIRNI